MAVMIEKDETLLNSRDVARLLDMSPDTVNEYARKQILPAFKTGRQWRFRKRDIDAWLDSQRTQSGGAVPAAVVRHGRARILVVDDEASIRDLLAKTLALAEYDVALSRVRASEYDLLIADLRMPGMDGLTLVRQVKGIRAELPVIIITGFSSETSAIEAVNLGVAGYLRKPFRVPEVLAAAAKALGVPAA